MKKYLKELSRVAREEHNKNTKYIPYPTTKEYFNACLMPKIRQERLHADFLKKLKKIKTKTHNDEKRWIMIINEFFSYTCYSSIVENNGFLALLKDIRYLFFKKPDDIEPEVMEKVSERSGFLRPMGSQPSNATIKMYGFKELYKKAYDAKKPKTNKQKLNLFKKLLKEHFDLTSNHLKEIKIPAIIIDGYLKNLVEFGAEIDGVQHLPVDKK